MSDNAMSKQALVESADFAAEAKRISEIQDPTDRLLRSGVLALIHSGRAVLETGLSPEVITRTAGRSRRSFYDHFRGKHQFSELLFDELLGIGSPTASRMEVTNTLLGLNDGDLFDMLRLMATAPSIGNVERVNRVARQIVSALGSNDDYARARIEGFYELDQQMYEPVITSLIDSWGLEFRDPWNAETVTLFFRIIVDGYAMRSLNHPDLEETEAVFLVFKTVFAGMTRLRDSADTDTVDDRLRETSDMAVKYLRERSDPSVVFDARQAVQDAMMSELAKRGFVNTRLDLVARAAGISQVTIRRAMGDVDDICCEMLSGLLAGLESAAEMDSSGALDGDALAILERHFERTAALMLNHGALMESISIMRCSASAPKAHAVAAELNRILEERFSLAIEAGALPAIPSDDVAAAALAVNHMFLHSCPDGDSAGMVEDAQQLVRMIFR